MFLTKKCKSITITFSRTCSLNSKTSMEKSRKWMSAIISATISLVTFTSSFVAKKTHNRHPRNSITVGLADAQSMRNFHQSLTFVKLVAVSTKWVNARALDSATLCTWSQFPENFAGTCIQDVEDVHQDPAPDRQDARGEKNLLIWNKNKILNLFCNCSRSPRRGGGGIIGGRDRDEARIGGGNRERDNGGGGRRGRY